MPAYLAALDHPANASVEAEAVRARLYAVLSKSDAPEARERLRRGFRAETDYVSRCIAEILHRQPSVVAGIVRDDLVRSFRDDPAYSQRILQFLRDEYVRVKREWVKGAPRELIAQLAPLLDRND